MDIREELCEHYGDDLMLANGYDDAIIGGTAFIYLLFFSV